MTTHNCAVDISNIQTKSIAIDEQTWNSPRKQLLWIKTSPLSPEAAIDVNASIQTERKQKAKWAAVEENDHNASMSTRNFCL